MAQFIGSIVGVVIGGLITWLCAWHYYGKAGDELKTEAGRIRKLTNLLSHAFEQAGMAEFKRDDTGEITSIFVNAQATMSAKSHMTATATVDGKAQDSHTLE